MIIVDRIIDKIAVCEANGVLRDIPLSEIDGDVSEGDVLLPAGTRYTVEPNETNRRRTMLAERFDRLKRKRD